MLGDKELDLLFREAHTYGGWADREVSDALIQRVYELAVWGPTSANCLPLRLVFIKSAEDKARLIPLLLEQNRAKTELAPVTAIVGYDMEFYKEMPRLFPPVPEMGQMFVGNEKLTYDYALRNGSLQGGYLILAIRALGLAAGPMSGFDNAAVDQEFFAGTAVQSNFLCNFGYGDGKSFHPRNPRLTFAEACKIL